MFSLYDRVPKYLVGKYQVTVTVIFTVLFALVMLLLSIPFLRNMWFSLEQGEAFYYTLAFMALGALLLCVSRRLMYNLMRYREMTYLQLIGWLLAEIVLMSLLYTFFTMEGVQTGILDQEMITADRIFFGCLLFVLIAVGVPFIVSSQYYALQDKDNTIRLLNLGNVVGDIEPLPHKEKRITLFDNSGVLKFSINSDNLYFIESDDNYVQVWYMDTQGSMKQYMLRCRLKTIEDSFADSDLVRCHRKYVVNMTKVKILTSEKDGYYIDLDIESVDPIPVSKTYEQAVLARFNSR